MVMHVGIVDVRGRVGIGSYRTYRDEPESEQCEADRERFLQGNLLYNQTMKQKGNKKRAGSKHKTKRRLVN